MKLRNKIIYLSLLVGFSSVAGAVGGIADVTVYDRVENRTLPIYQHNGRYYVVGKPGNEYQIRVANRGRQEILSVVSVDGVNAVSGETANWEQTGYVLGNTQAFDIRGWRKSTDRIAAFYFTEHQNSYAARTGRPQNVGVIGVAVFRKKYEPPVRIDPPVRDDVGSTASTATRWPAAVRLVPRVSMNVDLPAPGTPVMPTRCARPECGSSRTSSSCASAMCSALVDSTSVIARPSAVRSPASTPAT